MQEVLAYRDRHAARVALNARRRPTREFRPGDEVAVWRRGRGIPGKRGRARWRGPGIVAGETGGNYWVSMPGSFIKCSPEQLRIRTNEEQAVDRFLVGFYGFCCMRFVCFEQVCGRFLRGC